MATHYEILDVPPGATAAQIKDAYRILVQLHHPDRLQQAHSRVRDYAEDRLKRINEAYAVLNDPDRRARYDASLRLRQRSPADDIDDAVRPRRARTRREQAAARDWWRYEAADREAEARRTERARRSAEQARRTTREAEARARRAAREQYPRVRLQGESLILTLRPGLWTALVRIPAGEFMMGSDALADPLALPAEQPRHLVSVSDYYLGQYPVTNAQFAVGAQALKLEWESPPGQETLPAVNVTWDEAAAFCQWLSRSTGFAFRLPTEAEWEKAARGPDGRIYPWGEAWEAARVNADHTQTGPTAVGRFSPHGDSPFGLADMSGNVWEWCADQFAPDEYAARDQAQVRDPRGPDEGEGCVVRGGAFDSSARQARCAYRNWDYPFKRRRNVGFRLAVSVG